MRLSPVLLLLVCSACGGKPSGAQEPAPPAAAHAAPALSVGDVSPRRGKYIGGDLVAFTGTGFPEGGVGVEVYFGERKALNCHIESATRITCETPAGEPDTHVTVRLVFEDARVIALPNIFEYFDPTAQPPLIP